MLQAQLPSFDSLSGIIRKLFFITGSDGKSRLAVNAELQNTMSSYVISEPARLPSAGSGTFYSGSVNCDNFTKVACYLARNSAWDNGAQPVTYWFEWSLNGSTWYPDSVLIAGTVSGTSLPMTIVKPTFSLDLTEPAQPDPDASFALANNTQMYLDIKGRYLRAGFSTTDAGTGFDISICALLIR